MAKLIRVSGVEAAAAGSQTTVQQLVIAAFELSIDDGRPVEAKARALCLLAGHDRTILGRAWLSLVVEALRGNQSVVAAERLLAASLESEGQDGRVDDVGPPPLRIVS